ncbi:MAG: P1 family peptidase [Anaerolineales bacterium]|nr:P1 family peptidase [Anaerolineales bacterium]
MSGIVFDNSVNLAGLRIGHAVSAQAPTGCTVFLCPPGTTGSADVRGPAPGGRETALLQPEKPVSSIHAVTFAGGSAFGLAAADGVMRYLAEQEIGHPTPIKPIPIVPAAIIYDLFMTSGQVFPDAAMGYAAAGAATADNRAQGNVGAAVGATVGKWGGFRAIMKGGFGLASITYAGATVFAAAVVNAIGDVINEDGTVLAGARRQEGGWLVADDPYRQLPVRGPVQGSNTTLVVVATTAAFDKTVCHRLAQRAHDGLALSIQPIHTSHDGDTIFALSTGKVQADYDLVGTMAVAAVAEAVRNGVRQAESLAGVPGLLG